MNTVYKYCNSHGVDILRNLELKITPPNQFNDPFEFSPRVICSNLMRSAKRMVKEKAAIKEIYEASKRDGQFTGNFRQFRKMYKENRANLISLSAKAIPATLATFQKNFLDNVSAKFGVLCMSQRHNSILMWSHYCDKHQGIVIGFDGSNSTFSDKPGLRAVKYCRTRVRYDESWEKGNPEWVKFRDELVFSKNDEWAYEEELRQFFMLAPLRKKNLNNGTQGYFLPISPVAVLSMTLGARCSSGLKNEVRMILQDRCFSHVKLDHAVLHDSDFALKFENSPAP